jgi:6 kDa early secretory antigenic target
MGDNIKVDFGALNGLAGDIDGRVAAVEGQLETLRGQIARLDSTYEGSASDGYQQAKNTWNTAADDLTRTLAAIATAVHTARDNYEQGERSNAGRW